MKYQRFSALVVAVMLLAGCATISQKAKDDLAKPIDCSTAEEDIATLEGEKASVAKQANAGAGAVMPSSAVIGLLSGDYANRVRVASGQYNKDIDNKIAEIKATCGKK
jgi:outer membrane murein-binding lipoprotein Lpp